MALFLVVLVCAVLVKLGVFGERSRGIVLRAVRPAFVVGGIGFAAGFFGPILLTPDANQGPLLGIFITGPGGFVLGLAYGILQELRRSRA